MSFFERDATPEDMDRPKISDGDVCPKFVAKKEDVPEMGPMIWVASILMVAALVLLGTIDICEEKQMERSKVECVK